MRQTWHDLLFAHWRADAAALRSLLPPGLELDTFDGAAWVGIVPFRMTVRLRGLPPIPGLRAFPELNVRTYVTASGRPGVWFLSLDAANAAIVAVARRWFDLPYFRARMECRERGDGVAYSSERVHRGAPPAAFAADYRPAGPLRETARGSLDHWLTERYCLYARTPAGVLRRGEIDHPPWPLQPAEAAIGRNTMAAAHGIALPDEPPVLHFSRLQTVVAWAPVAATS